MMTEAALRRKRIQDAMASSINAPVSTTTVDPNMSTVNTPNVPRPNSVVNVAAAPPPTPMEPRDTTQQPIRVGYSKEGLSGLQNLQLRKRAQDETDPEQSLKETPTFIEQLPPRMKGVNQHSRLRTIGEAALAGLASGDPNNPASILGSGIGAAVTGAVNPRGGAQIVRKFEQRQTDDDIARGLRLEQEQAQLDNMQAPMRGQISTRVVREGEYPDIEAGTEIRVRVDPRTGGVTDVVGPDQRPVVSAVAKRSSAGAPHYEKDAEGYLITVQDGQAKRVTDANGKPVQVKKSGDDEFVEVEVNGRKLKVTPAQALAYYGQTQERETKRTEAQLKREAKLNESSSLYKKADALDAEAAKLFGQPDPYGDVAKRIESYQKEARDLRRDGDRARAEGEAIPEQSAAPAGNYQGRTISQAGLERYAKDKGVTIEKARKFWEGQGVKVQ